MNNYIIAAILIGLAVSLFRRGGLIKLILGLVAGFSGVVFLIDDKPMETLQAKAQETKELVIPKVSAATTTVLCELEQVTTKEKHHHRRPEGWFRDDKPTGINDGDTVATDIPGARWRDSLKVMRLHKLVGKDGHYFPPESEFERARNLYNRNWVFDGDKVYVREGPFDKIAIVRKTSDWYQENITRE